MLSVIWPGCCPWIQSSFDRIMGPAFTKKVALIVAHPDDETLWAGGTILGHPAWECFIVCLCRGSDPDRAPKFRQALKVLRSEGAMGDLDDGPDQRRLEEYEVEKTILELLPPHYYDLVISHHPSGEYTRHIRHEETGQAVIRLWHSGKISTAEHWVFAYEDGYKEYLPRPVQTATIYRTLTKRIWLRKYSIITETYGFESNSFEAQTAPRAESFWQYNNPFEARKLIKINGEVK
jgi:LmbE family N-acetylglucosaminyl deacetylase